MYKKLFSTDDSVFSPIKWGSGQGVPSRNILQSFKQLSPRLGKSNQQGFLKALMGKLRPLMAGLVPKWPWATHDLDWWWLFNPSLWNCSLNLALGLVCHLFSSPDSIPKEVIHWQGQSLPACAKQNYSLPFYGKPKSHFQEGWDLPAHWCLLALTLFSLVVTCVNQKPLEFQMEPLYRDLLMKRNMFITKTSYVRRDVLWVHTTNFSVFVLNTCIWLRNNVMKSRSIWATSSSALSNMVTTSHIWLLKLIKIK